MPSVVEQTILAEGAQAIGLSLEVSQLAAFARYQSLLLEWNQRFNLTAITDPDQIQIRHFLDALSCTLVTGDLNGQRLIDIGTGAGFPGLPLKILFPELELTLVDSVAKKCVFLNQVVEELALKNVNVIPDRAETIGHVPTYREAYDWAVARSVAHLSVLAEYLLPLCKIGGRSLALKGDRADTEVREAAPAVVKLGGAPAQLKEVQIPGHGQPHFLIVIEKVEPTPAVYPRRPGIPSKRPLT